MIRVAASVNRHHSNKIRLTFGVARVYGVAMNMDTAFAAVERRAHKLRLTMIEVAGREGISQPTLWRARNGKTAREATRLKVLRRLEARLDAIEAVRSK